MAKRPKTSIALIILKSEIPPDLKLDNSKNSPIEPKVITEASKIPNGRDIGIMPTLR